MQAWNVIKLVAHVTANTTDDYGDDVYTETKTSVYAECRSISQTEFYQAQTAACRTDVTHDDVVEPHSILTSSSNQC